jgi:beta-galactosidase
MNNTFVLSGGWTAKVAVSALLVFALLLRSGLAGEPVRERLLMDCGWRFALGHAADPARDFDPAPAGNQFSYLAKAGFAAGAAAPGFNDQSWRKVDLPHDWAVELPFERRGSGSHGFKAIGRNFPQNSVGWYRKAFYIPESDLGRRISLEFDGVFRDSIVWVNGHYLGRESSGYSSFARNVTEILNYGGRNVVVVRADASLEEGWFYEGAGIYRHVWLVKTSPLHVVRYGTFVSSELRDGVGVATARVRVANEGASPAEFSLEQNLFSDDGRACGQTHASALNVLSRNEGEFTNSLIITNARLWTLEDPYLYRLVTILRTGDKIVDRYETVFGIRSICFDPQEGFLLNGRPVKLKGTDNHQDHAGVGTALPDALMEYRVAALKRFGCNAYRMSHHPPAPELLDACDRLGVLVIDENRLMGASEEHLDLLHRMVLRDRNHPSVVLWSVGNEEWGMEGNETGRRVAGTMQAVVKQIDPTRPVTAAISGGWGHGHSLAVEVAGLNYLKNLRKSGYTLDRWHAEHPGQAVVATEECAFTQTRGIYFDDRERCHLRAYDWEPSDWGSSMEQSWPQYADRAFLAGMFVWTGFDYRGEPTPFGWPAIGSQFGILDFCGFPKDSFYYFRAWWQPEPVLHIFPHWTWPGKDGQEISVWAYSNCEEVELFLNGNSLGRKRMTRNSHLEWRVNYSPGVLMARGYAGGREILQDRCETAGAPAGVVVGSNKTRTLANGEDVVVVSVRVCDSAGRPIPTADNEVAFELNGPGRILGVGNGDPSSLEPDVCCTGTTDSSGKWHRRLFNGLAQVIIQTIKEPGTISLQASASGLSAGTIRIESASCPLRPAVTAEEESGR